MIVWGGYGQGYGPHNGYLNDGGRYDPATDAWSAPPTQNGAPVGRRDAPAVWTGNAMIAWGGYRYNYYNPDSLAVGTGGRYDPAADSWTATSMGSGVPTPRYDHTAVWTGNEMIVWGGEDHNLNTGTTVFDTGARYCACEGGAVGTWYPDADGDGYGVDTAGIPSCEQPPGYIAEGGDCDDRYASCTIDCTDADSDGMPACAPDCDESNPHCTTDCTDLDADGFCVTTDCDDNYATCITDCTTDVDADGVYDCADSCMDPDGDGYGEPGAAGFTCQGADCAEGNPLCNSDCTDFDVDGFCVTSDCDDQVASCTDDCSDPDGDLVPDCRDNCPGFYNPAQTDADLDGFGAGDGCDCDDTNPDVHPSAPELYDGLDNQCPGDVGYGLVDEMAGSCEWSRHYTYGYKLFWPVQLGATRYEVVRSTDPLFAADCVAVETAETFWLDNEPLSGGTRYYYLVRATQPHIGSWGADSDGVERTAICP